MNKQFKEPVVFEIQYNARAHHANIVYYENGQRRGFHVKHFEYVGKIQSAYFDERPRFRVVGKCTRITTNGDKTVIE